MSSVTACEAATIETMEPLYSGGFQEAAYQGRLWRCGGCGLVWTRRYQAEGCEARGHVPSYDDGPYGVRAMVNNQLVGNLHWYTRRAVRRDPITPTLVSSAV